MSTSQKKMEGVFGKILEENHLKCLSSRIEQYVYVIEIFTKSDTCTRNQKYRLTSTNCDYPNYCSKQPIMLFITLGKGHFNRNDQNPVRKKQ